MAPATTYSVPPPDEVGARIEALLEGVRRDAPRALWDRVSELVSLVVELYGAGLRRAVELLGEDPAGRELLGRLAADPLLASLLVLHGLHPVNLDERIQRALDEVRPSLGSHAGGVRYLGVDDDLVAHLRLEGSSHGCRSSNVTVRIAVAKAVQDAAPELSWVDVEGLVDEPARSQLLQLGPFRGRVGAGSGE